MSDANRTVLVVDDDAELRTMLREWLATHGFEVLEAANGLEALLQVKRNRPGRIVLDLMMPRLGGLDALKRIHAFDATARVVVVSAHVQPELERQARALGAVACLDKPVALPELLRALGGPVMTAQAEVVRSRPRPSEVAPAGDGSRARILVVDDDPEMRAFLEEALRVQGHAVRTATDAAAALRAITAEAPDVLLLDIDMPRLTGTDALPAIRAVAPEAQVIMVSGTTSAETAKRALALGAFDYVVKPVDVAYLGQAIESALAMRRV